MPEENGRTTAPLKDGERIDDLMYKGLRIIQHPGLFCFGTDAVLLAAFTDVRRGERVLDLCTGAGIVPLLLSGRNKACAIKGIEIQPAAADMARRSVRLNGLSKIIDILEGDARDALSLAGAGFDAVTINPPYEKAGSGAVRASESERIARHEVLCSLEDMVRSAAKVLRNGGRFYIVFRVSRFIELIETMLRHCIEPKRVRFVHPSFGKAPNCVLAEGRKNGRKGVVFLPPLYVCDENGAYTPETKKIYHLP